MDILDILDVEILDHFYIKDIKDIHYFILPTLRIL